MGSKLEKWVGRSRVLGHAAVFALVLAAGFGPSGAGLAHAGAWTYPTGTGQFILSTIASEGTQSRADGAVISRQIYRKLETDATLEYGFTDWLTGIVAPDMQAVSITAPSANAVGFGQSAIGARMRLFHSANSVFSVQAVVAVPGRTHADNAAEVGATDLQTEVRALAGYGFHLGAWPAFVDAEVAYRTRAGAPPDEVHVDITAGVRPAPHWLVMAQTFTTLSVGSARPPFLAGYDHKAELSVTYDLDRHWSLQVGVLASVAVHKSLRQRGVVAAVWRRF